MKRNPLLIAGTAALLTGLALAQGSMGGMDHSQMSGNTMSGMTMQMDMSGLEKLQGKAFDRAFLSMMIPHHQMAVDMSRAVLPLSKDTTVKTWANTIIKDQNREIAQMNTWLKTYGGSDARMANMMKSSMSGMADAVKKARNPDVAFVQGMLPHHSSAIDMAQMALEKSSDARVLKLARDIVTAQAGEMYSFRQWLIKRGA
ncbi:hypothetical protein DAERI_020031 [Deinococcus aerius]|uniref:DUF305 domain-containing protein n=2 Tax=Deinococcus TaxID=1298 RepID=A0A2I9CS64_9DEIO|nr:MULTISPECIES: DUF305 domain-containing protein [Deinococcus]MBB5293688.1 uncharacterized protein (DUF305 family) [Deinococcus metallilatus]QBY07341.1 DUF305 domain-containing protein [Deinococcus metallilatus]RXJ14814.1 DUF305 domain-containing protein [Deinococcus metallilatus]TLK30935.1 DUF305 domain-containing protein [Deinococcus metallilatus]GBF04434.1 hypothetical protein DAERI_020031 [Deinococcus aerius]